MYMYVSPSFTDNTHSGICLAKWRQNCIQDAGKFQDLKIVKINLELICNNFISLKVRDKY